MGKAVLEKNQLNGGKKGIKKDFNSRHVSDRCVKTFNYICTLKRGPFSARMCVGVSGACAGIGECVSGVIFSRPLDGV